MRYLMATFAMLVMILAAGLVAVWVDRGRTRGQIRRYTYRGGDLSKDWWAKHLSEDVGDQP
jgi:hypothetical protein